MGAGESVEVTIATELGESRDGRGLFRSFAKGARLAKAGAVLVGSIALGACTIVIPVVHFIAPWLLPLAGTIAAVSIAKTEASLTEIEGSCPACETSVKLGGGRAIFPIREACDSCSRPLLISVKG